MSDLSTDIQRCLAEVANERSRRAVDVSLEIRVLEVKRYQQTRFALTYADLLAAHETRSAARFFLDELYGPKDYALRDEQFARVVPTMVRLFPRDLSAVILQLGQLHALTEQLDSAMGLVIEQQILDASSYARAWRIVGLSTERDLQIQLLLDIGLVLARYVKRPLLRSTLSLMKGPASAAGLMQLHTFLVTGFDAFGKLGSNANMFLETIADRERRQSAKLFSGGQ